MFKRFVDNGTQTWIRKKLCSIYVVVY